MDSRFVAVSNREATQQARWPAKISSAFLSVGSLSVVVDRRCRVWEARARGLSDLDDNLTDDLTLLNNLQCLFGLFKGENLAHFGSKFPLRKPAI